MRGILLFAAKAAVSLALLYFAFHGVNFGVLRARLNQIEYVWIVATLATLGVQIALAALRWRRIAAACGAEMSCQRAALYTLIGQFFNQALPSTVGGDAARIWLLARDTKVWKSAIYSVLIDRGIGLIWLAGFVLVCLPWSLALIHHPVGRAALILIGAAGGAAPLGLAAFTFIGRTSLARFKVIRHLTDIASIALRVLTSARDGSPIAAISIAIHLLTVFAVWCTARAVGSEFTLVQSLLLVPAIILISAVPISIAGWGVRESTMIAAFVYAGLPGTDGLTVSILYGAENFLIGVIGGIAWSVGANRVRLSSLREASDRTLDV